MVQIILFTVKRFCLSISLSFYLGETLSLLPDMFAVVDSSSMVLTEAHRISRIKVYEVFPLCIMNAIMVACFCCLHELG